jgi:MFS family permease
MNEQQPTAIAQSATAPRWRELLVGRRARIVWTISLGVAIQAFGWFLVSTIMPSVVLDLGSPHLLSWGTTAFLALSIPGSACAGYLKGRHGTRRVLITASSVVIAANLLGFAAPDMEIFLVSRALQGLGEGMVLALCYILVSDSLDPVEVSPAFGILAVVWALATLIGPWLAGLLTDIASWRFAFLPMLAMSASFLWLVARHPAPPRPTAWEAAQDGAKKGLPLGRVAIIGFAIIAVSLAGISRDPVAAGALIVATLLLIAICLHVDRRSAARLFPADLLSLRRAAPLGIWILGLMFGSEASAPLYIAYFVQIGHGTSVFFAGQYAAITAFSWSVAAIFIGRVGRETSKAMLLLGPALLSLGLAMLIFWHELPLAASALALISLGTGFGVSYGFFTEHVIGLAAESERDVTAGAIPTFESICGALGAAISGLLGNAAGFGAEGAADIPAAVPVTVYGASAAVSLLVLGAAVRFRRMVIAAGR